MPSYDNINEKALTKLKRHGFSEEKTKTKYEKIRFKGESTVILYKTGKLLVQGSPSALKPTEKLLRLHGVLSPEKAKYKYYGEVIGSDESLKGDTFGGIVVCAFYGDVCVRDRLIELGVKDSKELNNAQIVELAKKIIQEFPNNYHVENIYPKDFNKLNVKKNMTEIMNLLHLKCAKKLRKRKAIHIVDKYPGCNVGDVAQTKAENKFLEVAAASIIARYEALLQIRALEQKSGFFIPMGSTHVDNGLLEISKKSLKPKDFVKLSFKNVKAFY